MYIVLDYDNRLFNMWKSQLPPSVLYRCYKRTFNNSKSLTQKHLHDDAGLDKQCELLKGRLNSVGIQMLNEKIHHHFYPCQDHNFECPDKRLLYSIKNHLKKHNVGQTRSETLAPVDIDLPDLAGADIDEHFRHIGEEQCKPYKELAWHLVKTPLPPKPNEWRLTEGWTFYDTCNGEIHPVDFPACDVCVFDTEVLMCEGQFPTLAVVGCNYGWYSWCSRRLVNNSSSYPSHFTAADLIPFAPDHKKHVGGHRLVIGHNVPFDRSYIREQYNIQRDETRFLDTMALHISVSGLSTSQKILYQAYKSGNRPKEVKDHEKRHKRNLPTFRWMRRGSLNNLADVHRLHCKNDSDFTPLDKSKRDIFVHGTMDDVRNDFQRLTDYCALDVEATYNVFKHVWSRFLKRFPHPVTLAGILEMSTVYLPMNDNWNTYLNQSETIYEDLQNENKSRLMNLASNASQLIHQQKYKDDPWLYDLDWSRKEHASKLLKKPSLDQLDLKTASKQEIYEALLIDSKKRLPKYPGQLLGYPLWYAELTPSFKEIRDETLSPDAIKISTQKRVVPKLLKLTWDGYPLYYSKKHKWGYLVPDPNVIEIDGASLDEHGELKLRINSNMEKVLADMKKKHKDTDPPLFPLKEFLDVCRPVLTKKLSALNPDLLVHSRARSAMLDKMESQSLDYEEFMRHWQDLKAEGQNRKTKRKKKSKSSKDDGVWFHHGDGPYKDVGIFGCCFYKIPHKEGKDHNVGNPLAKDFMMHIEDGTLGAQHGDDASMVLNNSKICSYWKMARDRIKTQIVVPLQQKYHNLPRHVTRHEDYSSKHGYSAILPRLVTMGTTTRRAVEATWLTASNANLDRIGSELKAMVQCPPGYHFVGADVDSQELWISALLGDAMFAKIHGSTAFGWMTLQGNKAEMTDLHSKTAEIIGITRDQAKVLNYCRIYGAGERYVKQLLIQFNHRLTEEEAKEKAKTMYKATKGSRTRKHTKTNLDGSQDYDSQPASTKWIGGSESHMFNSLESIANEQYPRTPVLGARMSSALEPDVVGDDFLPSRINWVVQSSAVDYLHLMLVSMRYLTQKYNIDARFSLSIHDEIRYMVRSEDRYRAALALHITNLFTRCLFAYKVGITDLPQSVAFFSGVDIDKCMRKEVAMDCKTPSNPQGVHEAYGVPQGESLDIYETIKKTNGKLERRMQPNSTQT